MITFLICCILALVIIKMVWPIKKHFDSKKEKVVLPQQPDGIVQVTRCENDFNEVFYPGGSAHFTASVDQSHLVIQLVDGSVIATSREVLTPGLKQRLLLKDTRSWSSEAFFFDPAKNSLGVRVHGRDGLDVRYIADGGYQLLMSQALAAVMEAIPSGEERHEF